MKRLIILIFLLAELINVNAVERGLPFMSIYPAKETGGHVQNWAIIQDNRGIMYIGNGYGVQEFDGSSWRLITSPNMSLASSFDMDEDGRIYVGYSGDFGYLETDDRGAMRFVSLLEYVKPEDRSFNYVHSVHVTLSGIYFQAAERVFRFRPVPHAGKSQKTRNWQIKTWTPQNSFLKAFWIDQKYYAFQYGIGLMAMENDSLVLAPCGDYFSQDRVNVMLPFIKMPGNYLIMTRSRGLFVWDGLHVKPFEADTELIISATPYCGEVLPDGKFAIGTLTGGFFIIDENGKTLLHIDRSTGLSANTVGAVYIDKQNNIWLGVDGAITTLEYNSPLSRYPIPAGNGVNDIRRHEGVLYISTNEGLFYLDSEKDVVLPLTGDFFQNQSLGMFSVNNELFAASGSGIIRIHDKTGMLVLAPSPLFGYINKMRTCCLDSAFCFAAQVDGASLFRYHADKNPRFSFHKKIPGIHEYVLSLIESEPGTVWCSTLNAGIIRFTYTKNFDVTIERFSEKEGLPAGGVLLFKLPARLVAATKEGPFKYDEPTNRFVRDSLFKDIEWGISSDEGAIVTDHIGNIWANLGRETVFFAKQPDGSFQLQKYKLARFAREPAICIYPEKNGIVWFGTSSEVIGYSPGEAPIENPPVSALIRRVIVGRDSVVYDGSGFAGGKQLRSNFPFRLNNVRFEFALLSYIATHENQFQTRLEGFDDDWSDWSRDSRRSYTNLPAGNYRFLVNARNINGQEAAPAEYAFAINSPWYATGWAYLIYVLAAVGIFSVLVRVRTQQLQQRSKTLEKIVRERTAEIQSQKDNVEQLSRIGRNITENLSIKTIINTVYQNVNNLMDASVFGIGLYQTEKQLLVFPATKEKDQTLPEFTVPLNDDDRLAVWCFKNRQEVIINDYGKDYRKYIQHLKPAMAGENPESILYLPLQHKDKIIGVITAQSFTKNAYTDYHLNILRNLATYSAIALENADAYRQVNELLNDLKNTQNTLVTQSKLAALGALTAGIAHEIKNPLNFVNNFAELSADLVQELREELRQDPLNKTTVEDILETLEQNSGKIKEHGKRADSIVRSMLQHSRGKAGERQPTDINAMLEEDINLAYHGMRALDSNFNIKIVKDLDQSIGILEVVPQDVSRVFLNIINNGCYEAHRRKTEQNGSFTPTLTVRSKNLGDKIEIRIRDNGNGIPVAVRDKLFTPFFTTKPAGQGTGLGLSISYDIIVHAHQGELFFETHEGEYAEFVIHLPRIN